ncbi:MULTISPECIES: tellurite resistance TerB family protein [Vibrio]|uniref:Tellurite resistance TerB family protein n=1 Tax=Vibrio casei TaxID=673372 RepID=A0A368LJ44_9VIBR|nr:MULTISPECIES: tellurite resistance TerB family protein [Vibrio]RCS70708.1 tellurite resistance TerB family protein [Vibrio casei]SJN26727.1 putative membrane protein [Vibrio casei]HBV75218.1 DUF533 domain-containing protein [Vibrio sp.]
MKAQGLLNSLLAAGQQMAQKGGSLAQSSLNVPDDSNERKAMLGGMGKGAVAAGAVALLLGTKKGRKLGGSALKIGSVAALGGLAFKAYQNWQQQNQSAVAPSQTPSLEEINDDLDERSKKLLQAVIAAAKADGHIDEKEQATIDSFIDNLGESRELSDFIQRELKKPLDPAEIAQNTHAPGLAAEVYLMSKIIVAEENFMEKAYLTELANKLNLEAGLIAELDEQVKTQDNG